MEKAYKKDTTATHNFFFLSSIFNKDIGFACLAEDLERESVFDIRLNLNINVNYLDDLLNHLSVCYRL